MAPRVEKTEVFKKGWNFANRSYFASCIMRKHYFLLWTKERTFSFVIFTEELFSTALNYLTAQPTLNCTWIFFYFKTQIKHLRSNIWIKKQPLISGSAVPRGFHWCFIFYECFWGFWSHFSDPFLAELFITYFVMISPY